MPLLNVEGLTTRFHTRNGVVTAVNNVSFSVDHNQTLAIVGESGSGKSVACYSILKLIPQPPGKIEQGIAEFMGHDLLKMSGSQLRKVRGSDIALIFQDPMTSLNPFLSIGEQLIEPLLYHRNVSRSQATQRGISLLDEVGIKQPAKRFYSYPHEFSGGMQQRVMIAMALITEPKLLIADEPTTALDVTVQAQILQLIRQLQQRHNIAVIFISHDLAVVADIADKVAVMQQGKIVEQGSREHIFNNSQHPYTQKLLASIPKGKKKHSSISEKPLVEINQLQVHFHSGGQWFNQQKSVFKAVNNVDLIIQRGEVLGLVGESGSGKSTLGRAILQLQPIHSGSIKFDGCELTKLSTKNLNRMRRRLQMIFQDPYASLNPRMTVFDTIAEPLLYHRLANRKNITQQVIELADEVGLTKASLRKYPHEFSGGQRQRIAIARAIATKPELIIADEPVSALDVTIQAQVLKLLLQLIEKHQLSMLFISHDLSVVKAMCDRIMVMHQGKIVETGSTEAIYADPQHAYTKNLIAAIPQLD